MESPVRACIKALVVTVLAVCAAGVCAPRAARAAQPCPAIRASFSIGYAEAFEHPIDDREMLILISNVGHSEGLLTTPLHLAPGAPPDLPLMGGSDAGCRQSQVAYAVARTMELAVGKWGSLPARLDDLVPRLEAAFEALALRDRLDRRIVDAALRPFGMTSRELERRRDTLDVCAGFEGVSEAHNADANVGVFVDGASRKARLRVRVDLTSEALVRDVRILSNSAAGKPYAGSVIGATLDDGAGAPYYTTCTDGRRPQAASFVYTAEYK